MRGKHGKVIQGERDKRITPAHAGKTCRHCRLQSAKADHPRACGENWMPPEKVCSSDGSPPRMRGKRHRQGQRAGDRRITPAHAGKTCSSSNSSFRYADHPRACGENVVSTISDSASSGSPPRMRGKRGGIMSDTTLMRITPAHAGKTQDQRREI